MSIDPPSAPRFAPMDPNPLQIAQARLAQQDIHETLNRLIREGMDPLAVLTAAAAATADMVACLYGVPAVPDWLTRNAEAARQYVEGGK